MRLSVFAALLPGAAFATLVVLLAVFMIADGLFALLFSVGMKNKVGHRGWLFLLGAMGTVAGVLILFNLVTAVVVLIYLFASWLFFAGMIEVITAIRLRKVISGEGWYILSGVLSMGFAVAFFIVPMAGVITLTFLFGIYAMINGISVISLSLRLKKHHDIFREKGRYGKIIAIE